MFQAAYRPRRYKQFDQQSTCAVFNWF